MISGLLISIGLLYRLSCIVYTCAFCYLFALDMATYLNHFYLVLLLSSVFTFMPANRMWSIDALLFPSIRSRQVPQWTLNFWRYYLAVVYFYAGVAKMNEDWLRGEPLLHWLPKRGYYPVLGVLLQSEFLAYFFSYGGLVYDLFVGPALLYRPTMKLAFLCSVFFHCTNKIVFNIGIFPQMMLASMTLFFHPSWPRFFFNKIVQRLDETGEVIKNNSYFVPKFVMDYFLAKEQKDGNSSNNNNISSNNNNNNNNNQIPKSTIIRCIKPTIKHPLYKSSTTKPQKLTVVGIFRPLTVAQIIWLSILVVFVAHQIVVPLRHHLYPGDVAWNEYGHRFSWRMKLRDKTCVGDFKIANPQMHPDQMMTVTPAEHLSQKQWRKTKSRAELVVQFAHYLRDFYQQDPSWDIQVYANISCQMNFRPIQQYIRPDVNLAAVPKWQWPYPYVTELKPLPQDLVENGYPWYWSWERWVKVFSLQPHDFPPEDFDIKVQSHRDYYGPFPPQKYDRRQFIIPPSKIRMP